MSVPRIAVNKDYNENGIPLNPRIKNPYSPFSRLVKCIHRDSAFIYNEKWELLHDGKKVVKISATALCASDHVTVEGYRLEMFLEDGTWEYETAATAEEAQWALRAVQGEPQVIWDTW